MEVPWLPPMPGEGEASALLWPSKWYEMRGECIDKGGTDELWEKELAPPDAPEDLRHHWFDPIRRPENAGEVENYADALLMAGRVIFYAAHDYQNEPQQLAACVLAQVTQVGTVGPRGVWRRNDHVSAEEEYYAYWAEKKDAKTSIQAVYHLCNYDFQACADVHPRQEFVAVHVSERKALSLEDVGFKPWLRNRHMNYIRSSLQHFSPKELDEKKKQGRRKLQQGPAPESGGDGPGADEDRPQKAQTVRSPSRSSLLASSGRPERRQPEGARGSSWSPSLRRPRTPEHPTRREFEEAARGAEGRELDERHREDRRRDKRREVGERGRREDRRECSVLLAGLGEELAARARHGAPGQTKDEIKGEKRRIRHTETSARIRPKEVLVKKAKECPEEKGGVPTRSLGRSRSRKRRGRIRMRRRRGASPASSRSRSRSGS